MKNLKKYHIYLFLFGFLLNFSNSYSQYNKEETLYNWFDNAVGKENLSIRNGKAYKDLYRTIGDNNMYYIADKFTKGNVTYDGQQYYDMNLKYNIHKDELIINVYGDSNYSSLILIQDKTSSFYMNGKTFVKLNKSISVPQITTGYYELNVIREGFNFYIKHLKKMESKTQDYKVYSDFTESNSYFIFYKDLYYSADSKSAIIKIFPNQKKQINDFYAMNREIRKSNNDQFMINLFKHINTSL